ncbi:hypothetical protein CC1G_02664 [Coprinopsis cinerea okayama7|uniref:Uncharacterized protein n=1 Tax=Coprinopsis cinerea (strain Okayama-7 / 130 / ATCC MYA-4618 / FGSC 9003) TaxID=240176 RepID=A8PBJ8_COPC7|nr:hypothetical protein CC1G_02664 [Coprinopsis cinerea okayama7\|eukprot:XP_001840201.1 hypothetical protein CC1G_02664 [Coprinopsis cinerea okayama7\
MPVPQSRSPVLLAPPPKVKPPRSPLRIQPTPFKPQKSFLILDSGPLDTDEMAPVTSDPPPPPPREQASSPSTSSLSSSYSASSVSILSSATSVEGGRIPSRNNSNDESRPHRDRASSKSSRETLDLASATLVLEEVEQWLEYINKRMGQLERRHRKRLDSFSNQATPIATTRKL